MAGWIIGSAAVLAALGVILGFGRSLWRLARKINKTLDDWAGEPARPGVPERPGVMSRLASIETSTSAMHTQLGAVGRRLESVEHELHPNSGTSLRDAVNDIHGATVDASG